MGAGGRVRAKKKLSDRDGVDMSEVMTRVKKGGGDRTTLGTVKKSLLTDPSIISLMRDALLGFLPTVRCTVDVEDVAEGSVHVSVAGVE